MNTYTCAFTHARTHRTMTHEPTNTRPLHNLARAKMQRLARSGIIRCRASLHCSSEHLPAVTAQLAITVAHNYKPFLYPFIAQYQLHHRQNSAKKGSRERARKTLNSDSFFYLRICQVRPRTASSPLKKLSWTAVPNAGPSVHAQNRRRRSDGGWTEPPGRAHNHRLRPCSREPRSARRRAGVRAGCSNNRRRVQLHGHRLRRRRRRHRPQHGSPHPSREVARD